MILQLTKEQWMLLIIYNIGYFLSGSCHSVQAPFYPSEAEEKGVSSSQYGFVFGVYYLTAFITSPLCAKVISHVGSLLMSYIGLFIAGVTSILFGVIDKINSGDLFFAFSMIIRIMESIGTTAFKTTGFSIVANEFPDNIGVAFASLESFFAFGVIVGPTVGGALYQWKGYSTPFLLIGILLLINAAASAIFLTKIKETVNNKPSEKGFLILLKQPEILLGMAASFGALLNISFNQATLEPHLRPFQLSPVTIGAMFIINSVAHLFASPLWGIICDKWISPQFVWSIGAVLVSTGLLLLGPAPYLPLQLSIPLCICALIIHGMGQSAEMISAFYCFSKVAIKLGFPDDVNTYGIASAIYNASGSLGGFVGPSLGGLLYDYLGYPWAVHFLICFHIMLVIITIPYNFLYKKNIFPKHIKDSPIESEETPIIEIESIVMKNGDLFK